MEKVMIGCKLPRGLMIGAAGKTAMLRGDGLTAVDKDLADAWFTLFGQQDSVKKGLVFIADASQTSPPAPETAPQSAVRKTRRKAA